MTTEEKTLQNQHTTTIIGNLQILFVTADSTTGNPALSVSKASYE